MKHSKLASEHGFISCDISLKNELFTCYIWDLSLPVLAYHFISAIITSLFCGIKQVFPFRLLIWKLFSSIFRSYLVQFQAPAQNFFPKKNLLYFFPKKIHSGKICFLKKKFLIECRKYRTKLSSPKL